MSAVNSAQTEHPKGLKLFLLPFVTLAFLSRDTNLIQNQQKKKKGPYCILHIIFKIQISFTVKLSKLEVQY